MFELSFILSSTKGTEDFVSQIFCLETLIYTLQNSRVSFCFTLEIMVAGQVVNFWAIELNR
jgi:hypothetical protein